jgi:hypothetical protein
MNESDTQEKDSEAEIRRVSNAEESIAIMSSDAVAKKKNDS